jgi:VanZ family protein
MVRRPPRRADQAIFGVVMLLSAVILFWPTVPGPPLFPYADKVIHFLLFAALAWTGARAGLPVVAVAIGLTAYASLSEVIQGALLPGRSGSWSDLAADLLGVALGLIAARPGRLR